MAHTLREFRDEHLSAQELAPQLSLVAEDGDRMAGFLLARRWRHAQAGFVDILAVAPRYQRHGLGSALLRTAFTGFAADGLRQAQLDVSSENSRARELYERLGMTTRFQVDVYERPVRAGGRGHE
jgi:ribosomal protein S18 acetylase RimI-like enzyme